MQETLQEEMEKGSVGMILLDREGRLLDINPALERFFPVTLLRQESNTIREIPFFETTGILLSFDTCIKKGQEQGATCHIAHAGKNHAFRYHLLPRFKGKRVVQVNGIFIEYRKSVSAPSPGVPAYFNRLLSSISPIVTLDEELRIRYANDTFLKDFQGKNRRVYGVEIFRFFPLSRKDRKELLQNIQESRKRPVQNCEFRVRRKIYGYSIFRFENEIGIIVKEITGIKILERKVAHLHSQLLELQERERQKLASELHDSVGQTILAAKLNFNSFLMNPEKSRDRYETGLSLIDRASEELREIYTNLYPSTLRDLGLEATIRWYARNFLELKNIHADLSIRLKEKLPHHIEVNLFRIIQELFTNIVKHSRASLVRLDLKAQGGEISLLVEDNGVGFSPQEVRIKSGGYGLENLRSRVEDLEGSFLLEATPGEGTQTEIRIPIQERGEVM